MSPLYLLPISTTTFNCLGIISRDCTHLHVLHNVLKTATATMAPTVWQRHPRYSVMVMVAILTTVYLLMPYQPEPAANYKRIVTSGADLDGRMLQSHGIYDRLLEARKGLIKKFGPNPSDIALYVVYLYPRRSGFNEISFF